MYSDEVFSACLEAGIDPSKLLGGIVFQAVPAKGVRGTLTTATRARPQAFWFEPTSEPNLSGEHFYRRILISLGWVEVGGGVSILPNAFWCMLTLPFPLTLPGNCPSPSTSFSPPSSSPASYGLPGI